MTSPRFAFITQPKMKNVLSACVVCVCRAHVCGVRACTSMWPSGERVAWARRCRICMSWLKWSKCRFGFYTWEQRLRPIYTHLNQPNSPSSFYKAGYHQGWEQRSAGKEITLSSRSNLLPRYGIQGFIWKQGDVANAWTRGPAAAFSNPLSLH